MLTDDRLAYLEVMKSGSMTTVDVLLTQGSNPDRPVTSYWPIRRVPPAVYAGRLVFATVRSPWDWYRSFWLHVMADRRNSEAELQAWGRGSTDFRDVLWGWTHPAEVEVPSHHGMIWSAKAKFPASHKHGYYTWYVDHMLNLKGRRAVQRVVPTDRLLEGLEVLLGEPVQEQFRKPRNTRFERSASAEVARPYHEVYDDEMIGWVALADRPVVDRYGFAPFTPAPKCIYDEE